MEDSQSQNDSVAPICDDRFLAPFLEIEGALGIPDLTRYSINYGLE